MGITGVSKVKLQGIRRIGIVGEYIKLDALLKFSAIASTGGEAKLLIQSGKVFVGTRPCLERGKKIRHGSVVRCGQDVLLVAHARSDNIC